jgi:hypothetical protein
MTKNAKTKESRAIVSLKVTVRYTQENIFKNTYSIRINICASRQIFFLKIGVFKPSKYIKIFFLSGINIFVNRVANINLNTIISNPKGQLCYME